MMHPTSSRFSGTDRLTTLTRRPLFLEFQTGAECIREARSSHIVSSLATESCEAGASKEKEGSAPLALASIPRHGVGRIRRLLGHAHSHG